jgi:hypothetical protein
LVEQGKNYRHRKVPHRKRSWLQTLIQIYKKRIEKKLMEQKREEGVVSVYWESVASCCEDDGCCFLWRRLCFATKMSSSFGCLCDTQNFEDFWMWKFSRTVRETFSSRADHFYVWNCWNALLTNQTNFSHYNSYENAWLWSHNKKLNGFETDLSCYTFSGIVLWCSFCMCLSTTQMDTCCIPTFSGWQVTNFLNYRVVWKLRDNAWPLCNIFDISLRVAYVDTDKDPFMYVYVYSSVN